MFEVVSDAYLHQYFWSCIRCIFEDIF